MGIRMRMRLAFKNESSKHIPQGKHGDASCFTDLIILRKHQWRLLESSGKKKHVRIITVRQTPRPSPPLSLQHKVKVG